jgi:hypothetical protein
LRSSFRISDGRYTPASPTVSVCGRFTRALRVQALTAFRR